MKKIFIVTLLLLAAGISVNAQKTDGSVKGKLMDTASKQPIADATVSLLNTGDSSLHSYVLTGKQGAFELKGLAEGNYQLVITHQGYEPV